MLGGRNRLEAQGNDPKSSPVGAGLAKPGVGMMPGKQFISGDEVVKGPGLEVLFSTAVLRRRVGLWTDFRNLRPKERQSWK